MKTTYYTCYKKQFLHFMYGLISFYNNAHIITTSHARTSFVLLIMLITTMTVPIKPHNTNEENLKPSAVSANYNKDLLALLAYGSTTFSQLARKDQGGESIVSFISNNNGKQFAIKQIQSTSIKIQFKILMEVLGCVMGSSVDVRINKAKLIPGNINFLGKPIKNRPASMHTFAYGIRGSFERTDGFGKIGNLLIDVHLLHNPPNTNPTNWKTIINSMSKHQDLPPIVALDVFVGNRDRAPGNLFYEATNNKITAIDMANSFLGVMNFCQDTLSQLSKIPVKSLNESEFLTLKSFHQTLKKLTDIWPPEKTVDLILTLSNASTLGTQYPKQDLLQLIEEHCDRVKSYYSSAKKLVSYLDEQFDKSDT